ncbi:MAG: PAS domain S-box protein, partial [Anaerolineae bacterium]|nr:PAS domain S-box protein [Anaerolineae bacterium]
MAELIVPEYLREKHRAGMQRFLKTGEQKMMRYGRVRLEGMRKSGEVFPVELSMSVAEADGEQVFVSFLRDITADLAAEDMLRAARDRAQESEKAKSDLLTVMSHEMRTPLNGILGSLSLIDFDELSERNKRHVKSIEISGELILSHVNDVLDLSNQNGDSPKRKKVAFDLRELVCKVWTSLRANAEARGNQMNVSFLTETPRVVLG